MSVRFPYMLFAKSEAVASPFALTQSGMPAPDPGVLGPVPLELGPPGPLVAQLEARLAHLFGVEKERCFLTAGTSGALHLLALAFFGEGSTVLTELPSYEPFRALPELFGARTHLLQRRFEDGWQLPLGELEAACLAARGPAHAFLCNPHNPTGVVSGPDELRAAAAAVGRTGGVLLMDEVYMEMAPPDGRVHAFALAPNGITYGSLTKAYGLGALRLGWIILGTGLVHERERLTDLHHLISVDLPTPAVTAGLAALERLPQLLQPLRQFEATSRPLLEQWLARSEHVEGTLGPYTLAAFPRVVGVDDTRALAKHLAAEYGVGVTPGEFFGAPGHVRIGYGLPAETLKTALERLETGLTVFRT